MDNKLAQPIRYWGFIKYALPTIVATVFMNVYSVVDGLFVSNCVGTDALSAVNITMPVLMIGLLIGTMLGTGGNALIAKQLGEQKYDEARGNLTQLVIVGVVGCTVVCGACALGLEPLLRLLGSDSALMPYCMDYTVPMLIILPFTIPGIFFAMSFITAGRPMLGLAVSVAGGVTNMVLDWLFIYTLGWGVAGAAWATGIGYCVPTVIGLLYFLLNRRGFLYLGHPRWNMHVVLKSCGNGASEAVGMISMSVVTIIMNNMLMYIAGSPGVAAVSVVLYAQSIFSAIYRGYAEGIAPIVSYNLGAQESAKVLRSCKVSLVTVQAFSVALIACCFAFAPALVDLFASGEQAVQVHDLAIHGFRIFVLCLLFEGANVLASALFTALNDGKTSAILAFCRSFLFYVPPMLALGFLFGMDGMWWSFVVAEGISFGQTAYYLLKLRQRLRAQ